MVSSQLLRSPARFFASSMSISECVSVAVVDGQLHQAAGVGMDGRFAQLRRVHLAQALEAGDVDRALDLLALDASPAAGASLPRRARRTPACPRRRGTAAASPRTRGRPRPAPGNGLQEQRGQQRRDVQAVGVGVGEDDDLAVAQAGDVVLARDRSRSRRRGRALRCEASTPPDATSQVLRILPRSGRIAWKSLSRACLALPPAESPSTRNSSVRDRSCEMQSASLPGRAGPWVIFLRTICFSVFRRALARSIASCAIRSPISVCWLSHSENASCAAPSTKPAAWRERQPLLGLAAELRVGHLDD